MNIRQLAEQDLGQTLEDSANGFGWPVTLTNPAQAVFGNLTAQVDDISQMIDPDTGVVVSGRKAAATMRISSLNTAGAGVPNGIADNSSRPWLITFDDINGNEYTFKVEDADQDRTLGVVVLMLGVWKE